MTLSNLQGNKNLPIEICGDDEDNCDRFTNQNALIALDRRRRDVFSNLGALHNLARLEDLHLEDAVEWKKRSGFTDGLLKAGEKLLDGSPGGFFMQMLKTIVKPVYNWVIGTDNDKVMEKFTKIMLPETQFRGHPEEYRMFSLV